MIYDFWSLFYPDLAPSWATLTQPPETLERHPRTPGDGVEGVTSGFLDKLFPTA